jgi:FkbM family methyltransferase
VGVPVLQRLIERLALSSRRSVRRTARAVGNARLFDGGWRYSARELGRRPVTASYRLRSGSVVYLRHPDIDDWIVWEIFNLRMYEPPPQVTAYLEQLPRARILDVGAHVGLFGRYILDTLCRAEVTSIEPSPASFELLRRTAASEPGRWRTIAAAAATSDGCARLTVPGDGRLHFATLSAAGTCPVTTIDVFPLLAASDLAKIDIEGGEWPILRDSRFSEGRVPPVLAIEYHPRGAPAPSPRAALLDCLIGRAGYTSVLSVQGSVRQGVVWAWDDARIRTSPPATMDARA